jgi:hypothetical protein
LLPALGCFPPSLLDDDDDLPDLISDAFTPANPNRPLNSSPAFSPLEPSTPGPSTGSNLKFKAAGTSAGKTPAQRPKAAAKNTGVLNLQDILDRLDSSAKDSDMLGQLGTQKHERTLGMQDLKRRKLEQISLEKQHQRERERDQHEYRMLQMRVAMSRNEQSTPSFNGLGLMAELNEGLLPSGSSYPI